MVILRLCESPIVAQQLVLSYQVTAGLVVNSSVTADALNSAVGSNVTAIDSSSGGAMLVSSSRVTGDVDNRTVVLSGTSTVQCTCLS